MFDQLLLHDPEEGIFGDCWRTCVGNLVGAHPAGVPHFAAEYGASWLAATNDWLCRLHQLYLVELPFEHAYKPRAGRRGGQDAWTIATGVSPRFPGALHAVNYNLHTHEVFDPHPDKAGLVSFDIIDIPVPL